MVDRAELADLLDCWEEQLEQNPRLTLDEFIAGSCHNTPPPLLAAFRRQVAQLEAMDRQLERIGADDTGGNLQAGVETDPARAQVGPLVPGAEPISGYVLIEQLGKGGFGEVWKASSPGGFSVALKFVRADDNAARIELRALETVKAVRHPHLLSIFGVWHVDGRIVIASELADGTLLDRFQACVAEDKSGIPRGELLEYFTEAAKGIDFLNRPKSEGGHGIQHRDIKPQNILVSGGSVKVGDFGLARSMQHSTTGHTGSLTLAYAAPEFLEGKTSDRSDQYSLAMTWCYLRTGKLPFEGTQAQVIAGHLHREPDLSMLPDSERPAVQRALAKNPRKRWDCCRDFVEALQEAKEISPVPDPPPSHVPPRQRHSRLRWAILLGLMLAVAVAAPFLLPKSAGIPAVQPGSEHLATGSKHREQPTAIDDTSSSPEIMMGLVSHWTCDSIDGRMLVDAAGSCHGEVHNNPQPVEGVRDKALLFDGDSDYIAMPSTEFPERFTIAAWVRPRESRAALCVFATKPPDVFGDNGFPDGIALFLNSNSSSAPNRKIHLQIHRATVSTGGPGFEFDEWTHLAVIVNKDKQQVSLFVNGEGQSHLTIRRAPDPMSPPEIVNDGYPAILISELGGHDNFQSAWRIAAFNDPKSVWFPFRGAIDDVRFYDRVLSAREIARLANRSETK